MTTPTIQLQNRGDLTLKSVDCPSISFVFAASPVRSFASNKHGNPQTGLLKVSGHMMNLLILRYTQRHVSQLVVFSL